MCDKRRLCLCQGGQGTWDWQHRDHNLSLQLSLSLSAPQMVCVVAAELTETLWKMIRGSMWPVTEWAECGQREGIVWFYLTFNSTRQVSISHQIVQTRANVLVCMGIHQNLYSLILNSFSLFQILYLLSSEMRQQQKFRGWFDYTWSRCRCSERREISISINYSSDRFHVRFREVMKYAVR